jgi:polyphosphate kinase
MRHVLSTVEYEGKDHEVVGRPDPKIVGKAADLFEVGEA